MTHFCEGFWVLFLVHSLSVAVRTLVLAEHASPAIAEHVSEV